MDSFEQLVGKLLSAEGWWIRQGFKVELTKEEKREIGKPSMPRHEIDILAYKPAQSELMWVECKSYLDSTGVPVGAFTNEEHNDRNRYKMFVDEKLRKVVSNALVRQLVGAQLILPNPKITYALVAGKIRGRDEEELVNHFNSNNWVLYTPTKLVEMITNFADSGYEDDLAMITAKILLRNQ